jgi:hypothetical protein
VAGSHPSNVTDRIAQWQQALPKRADFEPFPMNLPHVQEQLYTPVLDGLGLLNRQNAKAVLAAFPQQRAMLRKTHAELVSEYRLAASKCLPHRAFLKSLTQETAL